MRRRLRLLGLLSVLAGGCAVAQTRMQRALDPSMERVLIVEQYLSTVAGMSAYPERMSRSDGFVYISDLAPVLRYFAERGERERYVALRRFVMEQMMWRDATGLMLARRYRRGEPLERATSYGYLWIRKALLVGWDNLSDTASAQALAQLVPLPESATSGRNALYELSMGCADAMDVVASDPAPARAVLTRARQFLRTEQARQDQRAVGAVSEGEVDLLSCLTRAGLAVRDPDATVRHLDRMLDLLDPLVIHSGRADVGTSADILLTLYRVRELGPSWSAPQRAKR